MTMDRSRLEDFLAELVENESIQDSEWRGVNVTWPSELFPGYILSHRGDNRGQPLEVASALSATRPTTGDMRTLWATRGRSAPGFIVAVLYDDKVALAGPTEQDEVLFDIPTSKVETALATTLSKSEHNAAILRAQELLKNLGSGDESTGVINSGLFATHELLNGVPLRADWQQNCEASVPFLSVEGRDLFQRLGYSLTDGPHSLTFLTSDGENRAVAALLQDNEQFNQRLTRFGNESPVRQAQKIARDAGIDWVVVQSDSRIRLYPTKESQPVSGGTLSDRYLQLDLSQLEAETAGYLTLLFSATALRADGTTNQILESSKTHAVALIDRLKERVYADVIPGLSVGVANALDARDKDELEHAYHRSLVVLFRLIFLAYAEDEGLLPYALSPNYREVSLTSLARELTKDPHAYSGAESFVLWNRLEVLWAAVDKGSQELNVPAYNGGLFRPEGPDPLNPWTTQLKVADQFIAPVLEALLIDASGNERGPIDFRALDVTAFGTLYEGLLESEISFAEQDLVVSEKGKTKGIYVPAPPGTTDPAVRAGQIYFHSASGERKATGSYFTPGFAVNYLLDQALEPVLQKHLDEVRDLVESGEPTERVAEKLFDFRVIDPSMGSAHFLVAAVDRVSTAFAQFLTEYELPGVTRELESLQKQAREALASVGIDPDAQHEQSSAVDISLDRILSRQVARRCIYGIDLNLMAVELARLAIWIRTFVPGLPMASLGQRLVHGNALIGFTHVQDLLEALSPDERKARNDDGHSGAAYSFAHTLVSEHLESAAKEFRRLGMASEGTIAEIRTAREEYQRIWNDLQPMRELFNLALAITLGFEKPHPFLDLEELEFALGQDVEERLEALNVLHLPLAFPEVMTRERPGFDVVLGNPPWDKVKVEEHTWWTIRIPGLRSMTQAEKNAAIKRARESRPDLAAAYEREKTEVAAQAEVLKKSKHPIGAGDTDLYKIFLWRDWDILRYEGRIGVVSPRAALSGSGTEAWRREVLTNGSFEDLCVAVNNSNWVFDGVDVRYTIAFITVERGEGDRVRFHGPYRSLNEFGSATANASGTVVSEDEFSSWSPSLIFPILPDQSAHSVFLRLRESPRFLEAPITSRFSFKTELHTSAQKHLYCQEPASLNSALPVWTGRSFNLWDPDFGTPYAYAEQADVESFLRDRRARRRSPKQDQNAVVTEYPIDSFPHDQPRVGLRNVARSTDTRTTIAALIPPETTLVETVPFFLPVSAREEDSAWLVGLLSSRVFDWLARRYVEQHFTLTVLSALTAPNVDLDHPLSKRLIKNSGRLAAVDDRYAEWAEAVGVPVGSANDPEVKRELIAENDAIVAKLYGLNREQLTVLFETFHIGWDYSDDLARTLKYFDALEDS